MKTNAFKSIVWLVLLSTIFVCLSIMHEQSVQISQQQKEINRLKVESAKLANGL